jgi:hypothetical protein
MRLFHLTTHWSPGEARMVLEFLDRLHEAIAEEYSDDIVDFFRQRLTEQKQMQEDGVDNTEFIDDDIPF